MTGKAEDYYPFLKAAITEAKAAGLGAAVAKLEDKAFAAYTTSSELVGEHGLAIREFLESGGTAVPAGVRENLVRCLAEISKVWP